MTTDTWGYRYDYMENTSRPASGPPTVTVAPPGPMRSFRVVRAPGKIVLDGANEDRREYEGPYFTLMQRGQVVRRWRRVS